MITTNSGVRLEQLISGVGSPVTVFAHGLAGDIAGTRPLGSAVAGRRVFFHFRGHGRSSASPGPWTFGDLAGDLRAVADRAGATRAVGVSMGAAAICRLLADTPDCFERVVLYLPAAVDGSSDRSLGSRAPSSGSQAPSSESRPPMGGSSWSRPPAAVARLARLFAAIESGEAAALAEAVEAEMPPSVRNSPAGWAYLRQRVEQLQQDGLAPELDTLWREPALPSLEPLRAVTAAVLVIGCVGDEVHPVSVAERLAGVFPQATLHVYDRPAVLWTNRQELRERISGFLNAPTP